MQLEATRWQKVATVGSATILPAILIILVILASRSIVTTPKFVMIMLVAIAAALIYSCGTIVALMVTSTEDNQLECKSLLRRKVIPINEIRVIDARPWNRGFISIRAPGVYICLYRGMPGALTAVSDLVKMNPSINLRQ